MSKVIRSRVDDDLKAEMLRLCGLLNLSESELVRFFIMEGLSQVNGPVPETVVPTAENTKLTPTSVLMPQYVKEGAKLRAKAKGMKLGRWIASLVQSSVTSVPVMDGNEILALRESSRQLLAVGRNINKIAKSLNENYFETDRVKLDTLLELKAAIGDTDFKIQSLITASQMSWKIN